MPVIGHAFLGLAFAVATQPLQPPRLGVQRLHSSWVVLFVVLGYLPDVGTQVFREAGLPNARAMSHSIVFGLAAAAAAGIVGWRIGWPHAGLFTAASVWAHDLADVLQGSPAANW